MLMSLPGVAVSPSTAAKHFSGSIIVLADGPVGLISQCHRCRSCKATEVQVLATCTTALTTNQMCDCSHEAID